MCKSLKIKEETRYLMVQKEHVTPINMQPQKKPQEVVEQPQMEKKTRDRVKKSTQAETSSKGRVRAKWVEEAHATIPPGVWQGV